MAPLEQGAHSLVLERLFTQSGAAVLSFMLGEQAFLGSEARALSFIRWAREIVEASQIEGPCMLDPAALVAIADWLALLNVMHGTGGPFAALVVDVENSKIVSWAVNLGRILGAPFHAEVLALAAASARLREMDLALAGRFTLVSSSHPCLMCAAAAVNSGIGSVISGATSSDVSTYLGFDDVTQESLVVQLFRARRITVHAEVLRDRCVQTLLAYASRRCPEFRHPSCELKDRIAFLGSPMPSRTIESST